MIKEAIVKLSKKEDLTFAEAREVMNEIMNGQASGVQMAAYLTALSLKGETTDEITASAVGMREHCIRLLHDVDALEIVGTGGDHANSFNISTTAALVTAAGGVAVAKHGNRAARGREARKPRRLVEVRGRGRARGARREHHDFAGAQRAAAEGDKHLLPLRAELPHRDEVRRARAPRARHQDCLQHPRPALEPRGREARADGRLRRDARRAARARHVAPRRLARHGRLRTGQPRYELTPERFGYERCAKSELAGGTPAENAEITCAILGGADRGPKRSAVCLNAGAALYIGGKADSLEAGVRSAEEIIDSGAAMRKLEEFIRESNK